MTTVTARKIRDHGRDRRNTVGARGQAQAQSGDAPGTAVGNSGGPNVGRVYSGFLVGYPVVGRGMVIFRDPNGHRMVTTAVRRVLSDSDGETIYVETENSVYRLEFHAAASAKEAA